MQHRRSWHTSFRLALRAQLIYMGFHFFKWVPFFSFSQRTKKINVSHAPVVFLCWYVKIAGYWTRRAVLIIASEAEEYADPDTHTKTHTHTQKKTSAASRGFVVSSVGCLSQMRDTTNCPVAFFFALCPFHRFFFAMCLSHCIFFCTLPVPSLLFLTLCRSHLFFCTLSVTSLFFLQFGGCFVFFFAIPCPNCIFFEREDWRSQRCIFFARRICIIRLLQFRLHFSLHFCIYFVFFFAFFSSIFLHFDCQVAKKMQREKHIGFHCFFLRQRARRRPGLHF